ncbi:hypothetical protein ACP4OV_012441 [Aristida adscensionis]
MEDKKVSPSVQPSSSSSPGIEGDKVDASPSCHSGGRFSPDVQRHKLPLFLLPPPPTTCRCGRGFAVVGSVTQACGVCMSSPPALLALPPPASMTGVSDQRQGSPGRSSRRWPPTPEESLAIDLVLYGSGKRRRLPVFEAICPSDDP